MLDLLVVGMKYNDALVGRTPPDVLTWFQLLYEGAVNHHIYCIHYITKIFLTQTVVGIHESFLEVVSSPNPNTTIRERRLYPLCEIHNAIDVLRGQRLPTKYREVALDAVFLEARNDFVD